MRLCAWNLNNRVGKTRFRPEAAHAAMALGTDTIVFNEFYSGAREAEFRHTLASGGWTSQVISIDTGEKANKVLIVSRYRMEPLALPLPDFDAQFPSNIAGAYFPGTNLRLLGVRVPAYEHAEAHLLKKSWSWLEEAAATLTDTRAVIIGDLNARVTGSRARPELLRILASGWTRPQPQGTGSFFGIGGQTLEIDHVLTTAQCHLTDVMYATHAGDHCLAGEDSALSDHAALLCTIALHPPHDGSTRGLPDDPDHLLRQA